MSGSANGLLAIWSTVAVDFETDYLHWLTREHVFERVGIRGFRSGSVYRRRDSMPSEYVIMYELDDPSVMASAAYRTRLDNPTPWTQRVMPRLQAFRRGGGTLIAHAGRRDAIGSHLAVARFHEAQPKVVAHTLETIATLDRVTRARVMAVASDSTAISTREKSMRTSAEGTFSGIVAIDALDGKALAKALSTAAEIAPEYGTFETYELVFSFSSATVAQTNDIS